jgi:hypothetical protein
VDLKGKLRIESAAGRGEVALEEAGAGPLLPVGDEGRRILLVAALVVHDRGGVVERPQHAGDVAQRR